MDLNYLQVSIDWLVLIFIKIFELSDHLTHKMLCQILCQML